MPEIVLAPRARPAAWLMLAFPAAAFAVLGVAL
jgi:hypothetical protein